MPVYEYACASCGVFSALRKMSESSLPASCDECSSSSPRIMSVPQLAILGHGQRSAHERNERSAHEPKVSRRSSCGCAGSHTCKPGTSNKNAVKTAEGSPPPFQMQTKKSARPWMLGH
jgi:putative FmdB family regulatory protein